MEAHAWVQVGDVVVNDDPDLTNTYTELAAGDLDRLLPLLLMTFTAAVSVGMEASESLARLPSGRGRRR